MGNLQHAVDSREPGASPDLRPSRSPMAVKHVAACVDTSRSADRVLPHAAALARAFDAEMTVLHVLEPPHEDANHAPFDAFEWELRRAEARRYLQKLSDDPATEELEIHAELVEGRAAEEICDWVCSHHVDVTVLCTHGAGGPSEWSLASTATKLVEGIAGSLLIVPTRAVQEVPKLDHQYKRIVVPLDGSPRAESALPLVVRLATAQRSELVLVHVVPAPELTRVGPLTPEDLELERQLVDRNERVARDYLRRLEARLGERRIAVSTVLSRGEVRSGLLGIIEAEGADLVVVTGHGRTGRTELPYGSVTRDLIERGRTPLWIVREHRRPGRRPAIAKGREGSVRLPPLSAA